MDPDTTPLALLEKDWENLDQKTKIIIRLCLSYLVLLNVSIESTTKELVSNLCVLY
jgi:hypothetical protein